MTEREQFADWWERRGPEAVHMSWTEDACWFAWQASRRAALEQAANTAVEKLKSLTTEMEGYSYFGSNPGVKEDDYEDVADAIRARATGDKA
jgi:hypothetical protein